MLDRETRIAILRLQREGHGARTIARAVGASRNAVRKVLRSGEADVPELERATTLDAHLETVRGLYDVCDGNLVRVHEELCSKEVEVGYATLTRFCRDHGIGVTERVPFGRYEFEPGEEMQHDTSPHTVRIAARLMAVQCASLVLCFSRRQYAQVYPRWTRFECRSFFTEALVHFEGAAGRCVIDNTSVTRLRGTGKDAVIAPEMEALGKRFGFFFMAHRLGDKNRSARVERPFDHIEKNFYAGREFADIDDLNRQLRDWCERVASKPKRSLGCAPIELFQIERPRLRPLPVHVPEVYETHARRVDTEGYVNLHTNRYSVPARTVGRRVQVRETMRVIRIYDGHELVAEHDRRPPGAKRRILLDVHRSKRPRRERDRGTSPEEQTLRAASPVLGRLADELRRRHGGRAIRAIKQLHAMWLDYPIVPLVSAIEDALRYGLIDLGRIDSMVLERVRGDFFRLPSSDDVEVGDDDPASPTSTPESERDDATKTTTEAAERDAQTDQPHRDDGDRRDDD